MFAGNYKRLPAVEIASPRQEVARDEAGEVDRDWIMPDAKGYHEVCLGFILRAMGNDLMVLRREVSQMCVLDQSSPFFFHITLLYT